MFRYLQRITKPNKIDLKLYARIILNYKQHD